MALPYEPLGQKSLCESYQDCMQAFRKLIWVLGEDDCRVVHLEQVHLPALLDEFGRAKVWGDQARADLPKEARGSLDDILRHDGDLQDHVRSIFMLFGDVLGQGEPHFPQVWGLFSDVFANDASAIPIAEKKYDPQAGEDYDSVSSVSADSD